MKQDQFDSILSSLSNYTPITQKYVESKNKLLNNAKNFYEMRGKIIEGFRDGIFPLNHDDEFEEQQASKNLMKKNLI